MLTEGVLMGFPRQGLPYETELLVRRFADREREDATCVEAPDVVVQMTGLAQRDHITAQPRPSVVLYQQTRPHIHTHVYS